MIVVERSTRLAAWTLALATAALVAAAAARAIGPSGGLNADYFSEASWASRPIVTRVEPVPSTAAIDSAWRGAAPQAFSVAWSGWIIAPRSGAYTFATDATQHSSVFVDGRIILDNAAAEERRSVSGAVTLPRGAHALLVRYAHQSGPAHLEVQW